MYDDKVHRMTVFYRSISIGFRIFRMKWIAHVRLKYNRMAFCSYCAYHHGSATGRNNIHRVGLERTTCCAKGGPAGMNESMPRQREIEFVNRGKTRESNIGEHIHMRLTSCLKHMHTPACIETISDMQYIKITGRIKTDGVLNSSKPELGFHVTRSVRPGWIIMEGDGSGSAPR